MHQGKVYLVGAGPGDAGLITVRGAELLRRAEVVVHDRLVNTELLEYAPAAALCIRAGKSRGDHTWSQNEINALMILHARKGRRVVRLKGGDPFVFGRGGEEARALQCAGVPFEVVPGVTAATAVPAACGIPLTDRGAASSFAVVTGEEAPGKREAAVDWARLARAVDTLVVLMGVKALPRIVAELLGSGHPATTPVAVIRWGTTDRQEMVSGTLADIVPQAAGVAPPATVVIGEVAAPRERLPAPGPRFRPGSPGWPGLPGFGRAHG